jgi:hypothetical protein
VSAGKSKAWQNDISKIDNWQYDEAEDTWTCAAGKKLVFHHESKKKTESGFEIHTAITEARIARVARSSPLARKRLVIGRLR